MGAAAVGLDVYDDIERCMSGGWSDGLPVIPPYGSLVEDMLAAMGWDYTEVVGSLPEQSIEVHASHVAAAAVMAGCRFEYGPLLRALTLALVDPVFNLTGVEVTTGGASATVIVSGPAVERYGFAHQANCLGANNRANATVGRFAQMVRYFCGRGGGSLESHGTMGHPGRPGFCVAEHILGVGLDIPPATDTRALCRLAGADTREFRGWDNVCIAREDEHPALGVYQGAEFVSAPEMNGRVLIKYGGTRYPVAPPGISATSRTLSSSPRDEVRDRYRECYDAALTALTKRFGVIPGRLICNQITPGTVRMLTRLTGLSPSAVVVSGHDVGHIGPADIIVGIDRLRRAGQVDGPVAVASSTPYSFGFGLITPPAGSVRAAAVTASKGATRSMTEPTDFRRSEDNGVLTFTFTRDAKLNAVSPAMIDGLRTAVDDLGDRDDLKVLVIAAEGRYFTAGIDLTDSGAGGRRGYAPDGSFSPRRLRRGYRSFHLLMDELEAIEKPSVLAAHARCLGVGLEIGASCDFRLAAGGASFALPELPNLGVIPGSGGISRVTRLVGPHWGKWLAFGEEVSAELALTMGLVHAVYPAESFRERATAFARKLAALPSEAAGVTKTAVDIAASVDRGTAREFDRYANTVLLTSDEHKSMLEAFTNRKRAPRNATDDQAD